MIKGFKPASRILAGLAALALVAWGWPQADARVGLLSDRLISTQSINNGFVAPPSTVSVLVVGAGGSGGGGPAGNDFGAGGGAGGDVETASSISVAPGVAYTITVGTSAGVTAIGTRGLNGGTSIAALG